jgi:segregation and condensation protein B
MNGPEQDSTAPAGEPDAPPSPASPAERAQPTAGDARAAAEATAAEQSPASPAQDPPSAAVPAPEPVAPAEEASVLPPAQVRAILEALIFASPQPIAPKDIDRVLQGVPREEWQRALDALRADFARDERGLQVVEVAGGYQITTRPEYNDWVRELLDPRTPTRLSIQALETLAVIAYKQPVTLPEVIELRGVKSGGVVKTLLEKRLIRIMGRKEVVGRPILYGTTRQFLLHFGLRDLDELPKIEEFAEVLGEEVDVAGLKRAIESPLPVQEGLSDPDGEQIPLFETPPAEGGAAGGGTDEAASDAPPADDAPGREPSET